MGNEELNVRSNAIISELESQRNLLSVRATQLASELAVQTARANALDAECAECRKQNAELQNKLGACE